MVRSKEKHWFNATTVLQIYFCFNLARVNAHKELLRTSQPLPTWKESWDRHIEDLSVHSLNDHVAFFSSFYGNVTLNANELLIVSVPSSLAWKFSSKLINFTAAAESLGLYVLMSDQQYKNMVQADDVMLSQSCILSNDGVPTSQCYLTEIRINNNPSEILPSDIHDEIKAAANIINKTSLKETDLVSGWRLHDLLVYDELVKAGKILTANKFKIQLFDKTIQYLYKNLTLFSDLFLPIYEHHGGAKTVAKFLEISQLTFSNVSINSTEGRDISCGQFIHLWSQAAETDLRDLAYKAFGWAHWKVCMEQFQELRASTQSLNYQDVYPNASLYEPPLHWKGHHEGHTENLSLVFADENIAAYYDSVVSSNLTWLFTLGSAWWSYAKQTYELGVPDTLLYLLLHTGKEESISNNANNVKLRKQYHNRLVIDIKLRAEKYRSYTDLSKGLRAVYFGTVIKGLLKERLSWSDSEPDLDMELIIGYDLLIGTGDSALAAYYKHLGKAWNINWPRAALFTFRDWFYPIYSWYGGSAVLKRFFTLLAERWNRKNAHLEDSIKLGELVHWWSGAAGEDLSKLAIQAFGWSSTDNTDLAHSRIKYPQLNYTRVSTELPHNWKEHWAGHDQELTLVYSDDQVAFYVDPELNKTTNISWPFHTMSSGWKYAKKTYGSISDDPLLFIVLHRRKSACIWSRMSTYLDRDYENRNVIDCGLPENDDFLQNTKVEDILLNALGQIILSSVKKAGSWPGKQVSSTSLASILVYDILVGISYVDHAHKFLIKELSDVNTASENTINWFRDWHYPIYTKYGQADGINSFFEILHNNWPQLDHDYTKQLDLGTWVHFWSAAVGEYLWYEAAEFLDWGVRNHRLYLNARNAHPLIYKDASDRVALEIPIEDWTNIWAGSEEQLSLAYVDGHVAVYFDSLMDPTISWPFKLLSDAWRYVKKRFGSFSPDPVLYVVLHNGPHVIYNFECKVFSEYHTSSVLGHRALLDCGRTSHVWDSADSSDTLVFYIALLIRNMKQIKNNADYGVSLQFAVTMLVFDINIAIGRNEDAVKVFQIEKKLGFDSSSKLDLWWRNWFFPIYIKYGRANVIEKFAVLLWKHFPKSVVPYDYARYLNNGEFVHFWSGAAGVSLKGLSRHVFNWTAKYEDEYIKALQDFPLVTYKDSEDNEIDDPETLAHFENQFGHSEFLYQAYADSQINVYMDLDVSLQANWTFTFLSQSWHYTTLVYETLQVTAKNSLTVFLHSKKHEGCRTNAMSNTYTIDCGSISSVAWALDSPEDRETFLDQYVNIIQESSELVAEKGSLSLTLFKIMHKFDIYLRLGMFSEGHVLLSKAMGQSSTKSGETVFFVRDWLLSIYTRSGGVSVFNRFLSLVVEHWNPKEQQNKKPMNVGQGVHFWSSAAEENLFYLAQVTYGRNRLYEAQFTEARKDFKLPRYSCYDCHVASWAWSNSKNNDLVIGFSVGLICLLIASIFTMVCLYRRKVQSLKTQIRQLTSDEISDFFQGHSNAEGDGTDAYVDAKPFNTEYEIPKDQLDIHLDHVLGSGEFGRVLRGILKPPPGTNDENTVVAVKTVKPNVDVTYFKAFLTELKVMCYLGKHDNILSLLGAITVNIKNREVYVALELCPHGDLLQFLKNCRRGFTDLIRGACRGTIETQVLQCVDVVATPALSTVEYENSLNYISTDNDCNSIETSTLTLLNWACQVADGMAYIASKNVIHGDLAARNVLLTADRVAKISDFGLSRQLLNYSTYMKTSKTPVPWRWMAIESLRDMNFSIQSDVWAFGVTLYEIFSLGMTPYAGWTWDYDFVDKLVAGHRLSSPEFGNREIYQIMMDCMKSEEEERINYEQITEKLQKIKDTLSIPQIDKEQVTEDVSDAVQDCTDLA